MSKTEKKLRGKFKHDMRQLFEATKGTKHGHETYDRIKALRRSDLRVMIKRAEGLNHA